MKDKIKKILFIIAEIGTVIWAVYGMWSISTFSGIIKQSDRIERIYLGASTNGTNLFWIPLLFYFLSAILILYLLRKYEGKN